jgi:hypothetical protein
LKSFIVCDHVLHGTSAPLRMCWRCRHVIGFLMFLHCISGEGWYTMPCHFTGSAPCLQANQDKLLVTALWSRSSDSCWAMLPAVQACGRLLPSQTALLLRKVVPVVRCSCLADKHLPTHMQLLAQLQAVPRRWGPGGAAGLPRRAGGGGGAAATSAGRRHSGSAQAR